MHFVANRRCLFYRNKVEKKDDQAWSASRMNVKILAIFNKIKDWLKAHLSNGM